MSILKSALKKKTMAREDRSNYQNSNYRLTQKEQESITILRILLVLPILLILTVYAVS
jgi:Ser/Thr protein kinase RdoA (MazF antagonist)